MLVHLRIYSRQRQHHRRLPKLIDLRLLILSRVHHGSLAFNGHTFIRLFRILLTITSNSNCMRPLKLIQLQAFVQHSLIHCNLVKDLLCLHAVKIEPGPAELGWELSLLLH